MKTTHSFLLIILLLVLSTPYISAEDIIKKANSFGNISSLQAKKIIDSKMKDLIIIDIRTEKEYKEGHIPLAISINFFKKDFALKVAKLDKKKTYIMHCASGGRSAKALKTFQEHKIINLYHMNDGFNAWQGHKFPTAKGSQ